MPLSALAAAACAHPPRAVAPVRWRGPLTSGHLGLEGRAAPDPAAPAGVLRLDDVRLDCPAASRRCDWSAWLENPWHLAFEVTLVVTLRSAGGRVLASGELSTTLGAGRRQLGGTVPLSSAPPPEATFTVEYWVRPAPPPTRTPRRR